MAREKARFDSTIQSEMLQKLEIDTFDYINCLSDEGCQSRAADRTNTSFAVHGYILQALSYGFRLSDDAARTRLITTLHTNFTRCVMVAGSCTVQEVNAVYRQKRAVLRYLTIWNERLAQISTANFPSRRRDCIAPQCDIGAGLSFFLKGYVFFFFFHCSSFLVERSRSAIEQYLMSDYLPFEMVVPAWILYSLVLIASAVIVVKWLFRFVFCFEGGKKSSWASNGMPLVEKSCSRSCVSVFS